MRLSSRSKYGVRAMLALAATGQNNPVSINTISKRENISAYYLQQLFVLLKNGKLVKSTRGAKGGYVLLKSPDKITAGEMLALLEGTIEITDSSQGNAYNLSSDYVTQVLWERVKASMENVLNSITLQDILNDCKNLN